MVVYQVGNLGRCELPSTMDPGMHHGLSPNILAKSIVIARMESYGRMYTQLCMATGGWRHA